MGKKDTRIVVIYQRNAGLSDARNHGATISKGKYIMYVDSDDEIDCTCLNEIIRNLEEYEVYSIIWNATLIDEQSNELSMLKPAYYKHGGLRDNTIYNANSFIELQVSNHSDYITTAWIGLKKCW